jgi:hypothetical protein
VSAFLFVRPCQTTSRGMPKRFWDIHVKGTRHRVELEHSRFSGHRRLLVDGKDVPIEPRSQNLVIDHGSVHPFEIDGVPCLVVIRSTNLGLGYEYDAAVEGRSVTNDQPPVFPPVPQYAPWWAHAIHKFPRGSAAVCAVITLLSLGGVITCAVSYVNAPSTPAEVPLSMSSKATGAWVTLVGATIDCKAEPRKVGDTYYRAAGQDEQGALVLVASSHSDVCSGDRATGELSDAAGTSALTLRTQYGSDRVRVLWTHGGPGNDLAGIIVCSVMAVISFLLAAFAWVRRPRAVA